MDEIERLIRAHVLQMLPADSSGELATASLPDLLLTYGNWRSRFVHPHPRRVHLSASLQASLALTTHKPAVDAIVAAIEDGHDVTPHLSRGVKTAYVPKAQRDERLKRRADLDLLISDWGLHHLHLTTVKESDGFVTRTGDLLFGAFAQKDAYLIGIYPHGSWALRELVEILVREWPNSGVVATFAGVSLVNPVSEDDHLALRNGGVASVLEVDGTAVMPGLGMTTAGTPVHVTLDVNRLSWALSDLRGGLDKTLSALDAEYPPDGDEPWTPHMEGDTCCLRRGTLAVRFADLWG